MKKIFKMLFYSLTILSLLICSSCDNESFSSVEDDFDKTLIYGSWHSVTTETSEYLTMTLEVIWSFRANNVASQQVIATLNGYPFTDITNSYSYVYNKDNTITFTNANNKVWTYEITVNGRYMKLGNVEDGYWELTKM